MTLTDTFSRMLPARLRPALALAATTKATTELTKTSPTIVSRVLNFVGFNGYGGGALGNREGAQFNSPTTSLVAGVPATSADAALQLSTIWSCVERRAKVVASLPLFVYDVPMRGPKTLARLSRLYQLLHDSPNSRMTPFEFWVAMMMNHDLRGNAYARIERAAPLGTDDLGEAIALWPMPADQVEEIVLPGGDKVFAYTMQGTTWVYPEANVLHLKNLGNGHTGLDKLDFMAASVGEAGAQLTSAAQTFGNGGKPTAVLMIDKVLRPDQREALQARFSGLTTGSDSRLAILEANMKWQQLSISPEQTQLLESRKFSVEELCRWFDVPPVLAHHSNVTAWGTGIEQIVEGFHKFTIGPLCVSLAQAVTKRVMTSRQRANQSVEFSLDALLRATPAARFALYATARQNGFMTGDEIRQLENLPAAGGNSAKLLVQQSLQLLEKIGEKPPAGTPPNTVADPVAQ